MNNIFISFMFLCFLLATNNPPIHYSKVHLGKEISPLIEIKGSTVSSSSSYVLMKQTKLVEKKIISFIEMGNIAQQNPKSQRYTYTYFIYVKDFDYQNKNVWDEMLRYAESKPYEYSTDVYFYSGKSFLSNKINAAVIKNYGYPKYDKFIIASYFRHASDQVIAFKRFPRNRDYFTADGNWPYKDAVKH